MTVRNNPSFNALGSGILLRLSSTLLVIGFAVLLGIVAITYMLAERSRAGFDDFIAARDIRSAAIEVRNALLTAESSQRGFLLDGNEIYLAPYDTAKSFAIRRFDRLKSLLASDPTTAGALSRLDTILREKIAEMDATIELERQRKRDEVTAIIASNKGKALMDEANVFFTGIILAADDRLIANVGEQRSNFAWLRWVTIAGGIAIVLVVGVAMASFARHTQELKVAHNELARLNSGLEERVRERTADLIRANEEVQRFAYIVTHDLRAPLVNIMGFTSELEAGIASLQALIDKSGISANTSDPLVVEARLAANEDLPEAIGFIRSSTRKMDGLINAILHISREGRRPLLSEHTDLRDLVASSSAAIKHQVKEAGGRIDAHLPIYTIETDRMALEQVFSNLLDNAVKYRSLKRPLTISVRTEAISDNKIAIDVEDNGRGIATQDLERVFELFRRSGVQDQPGEGIGLAHVRAVVRRLGGDVTVKSTLDVGTIFRIILPTSTTFTERAPV